MSVFTYRFFRLFWVRGVLLFLLGLAHEPAFADSQTNPKIIRATPEQIEHWRTLRLGMFIHWGPVSLTGKEIGWSRQSENSAQATHWQEYDQLYKRFNPVKFDADEWVETAKQAGFNYIIFTSKHHDGFAMFDSDYTEYDMMSTPFQRDVMKELTDACKQQGLEFGPYHSICDWHHPDYGYSHRAQPGYTTDSEPNFANYYDYLTNQLGEMHRKYGPFLVFWFDGEWEEPWTHEYGVKLNNYCKSLQADALVNNRVDKGRRGMQGMMKSEEYAGDFGTPEQEIGAFNREMPWETCMTMGQQWSWKPNDNLKSTKTCLQQLLYTVGGDGNFLFNVGPMPDGRIEPRQVDRLLEMGDWVQRYGETIYGTRGGPFKPGDWGASTCKQNQINLFVMRWDDKQMVLPWNGVKVESIDALTGESLRWEQDNDALTITLLQEPQDAVASVIAITIDGDAESIEPIELAQG